MTSRERVIKAVNCEQADRVPIDLGIHFATGISAFAYCNLREYLGFSTDSIEISDYCQMLARVDDDILRRFHCDCILLNPPWKNTKRWNVRGKYTFNIPVFMNPVNDDGSWIITDGRNKMRMPSGGFFFDGDWLTQSEYINDEEKMDAYAKRAEYLYKETDYYTMLMGYWGFFGGVDYACTMYTDPDEVKSYAEKMLEHYTNEISAVIKRYGRYIQCIEVNADMGIQNGPYISPEMYEAFVLPYFKKFNHFVHENSDIKIFLHSCGSVMPLIDCFIEAEVDILNPVQISADNMNPVDLKEKFGKKICFWGGGCDTQGVFANGTAAQVEQHVKQTVDIFKVGGGFVFNQVHNIMGDIKPENIISMLDTAYKNSFY